jgi:hypothetical protein
VGDEGVVNWDFGCSAADDPVWDSAGPGATSLFCLIFSAEPRAKIASTIKARNITALRRLNIDE